MKSEEKYIPINKQAWNNRTAFHVKSDFYDVASFLKGKTSLKEIELQLLGDVKGKSILHLQCHFGQDSISLARMGAHCTGVDFSDKAIEKAEQLAIQANVSAEFVCCDIYDLPNHLEKKFDIVFTSYGTIGWLPNMDKWAEIVAHFLKPQGKFIFVEFHPVVWMFDDKFEKISYHYLKSEAIEEIESGTYADKKAPISLKSVTWNHGISEVVNSLIKHNIEIRTLNEYDYSPYNCFENMIEYKPDRFRIKHLEKNMPMVYAIVATKKF